MKAYFGMFTVPNINFFFPVSGPATGSPNGPHAKSNFLLEIFEWDRVQLDLRITTFAACSPGFLA